MCIFMWEQITWMHWCVAMRYFWYAWYDIVEKKLVVEYDNRTHLDVSGNITVKGVYSKRPGIVWNTFNQTKSNVFALIHFCRDNTAKMIFTHHESASLSALKTCNAVDWSGVAAISLFTLASPLTYGVYHWPVHCECALKQSDGF